MIFKKKYIDEENHDIIKIQIEQKVQVEIKKNKL